MLFQVILVLLSVTTIGQYATLVLYSPISHLCNVAYIVQNENLSVALRSQLCDNVVAMITNSAALIRFAAYHKQCFAI